MSSPLLELTRAAHEEVELLERLIVKDLQNKPATYKQRLHQSHRVRYMIDQTISITNKLVEIYQDKDNARKDEIAALGEQVGTNIFSVFYERLKEIHEYYRQYPSGRVIDTADEYEQLLEVEQHFEFSAEEAYGHYLDMHELYDEYIFSKFGKQIDYIAYLQVFSQPRHIPRELKTTWQYREYLSNMTEYLVHFIERAEPLTDLDRLISKVTTEFEEQWADGKVSGWKDKAQENEHVSEQNTSFNLEYYCTVDELVQLGPGKLKEALRALGLKTGGTVQQRAERLFLTKHMPLEKVDKKHFAVGAPRSKHNATQHQNDELKRIALMEVKIEKLCEILREKITRTKENVENKQGQTLEEIDAEMEDEELLDIESDDEDQQIHNPLKLPVDLNGKRIQSWMYKLHGLGQEFKCEICGDSSYWGRRAFELHFEKSRHQYGMSQLGIPNTKTKSFNEITSIQDAQKLWERIKEKQEVNEWRPDFEEEHEDEEGNVYNKKTYDDLKRQGLI